MKRPFGGIENEEVGGPRSAFLQPKNVVRDGSLPEDRNIVSAEEATYILRIDEISFERTRKKGNVLKTTFTVVAGDGVNAVGTQAVHMLMESNEYFLKEVKLLVANAMNARPDQFVESDYEAMVSPAQPVTAAKRHIRASVSAIKTKAGKDFTRISWSPIEVAADGSISDPATNNVAAYFREQKKAA